MVTSFFVLFMLFVVNGTPHADFVVFKDKQACETAAADITRKAIASGITEGSFECHEGHLGTLT